MTQDLEFCHTDPDVNNSKELKGRRVRKRSLLSVFLIILVTALVLGSGSWLIFRSQPSSFEGISSAFDERTNDIYYTGARFSTPVADEEWSSFLLNPYESIQKLYHGIPESYRPSVWSYFIKHAKDRYPPINTSIEDASKWEIDVDKDIDRTLTQHYKFCGTPTLSEIKQSLRQIVLSYSQRDSIVGYCQGMATPVAFLLTYFEAQDAQEYFFKFMTSFGMRRLYTPGFEGLEQLISSQEALMEIHLPHLVEHFTSVNIRSRDYAVALYLTWFLEGDLNLAARIWDLFPVYEFDYMTLFPRVVIALLKVHEEEFAGTNTDKTFLILKSLLKETDPDQLIDVIKSIN